MNNNDDNFDPFAPEYPEPVQQYNNGVERAQSRRELEQANAEALLGICDYLLMTGDPDYLHRDRISDLQEKVSAALLRWRSCRGISTDG